MAVQGFWLSAILLATILSPLKKRTRLVTSVTDLLDMVHDVVMLDTLYRSSAFYVHAKSYVPPIHGTAEKGLDCVAAIMRTTNPVQKCF